MEINARNFDREFALEELLPKSSLERLKGVLRLLLGGGFRLVASGGKVLLGERKPAENAGRVDIWHDLEPLGYLEAENAGEENMRAAAGLLELMLHMSARYHMASELHIESVQADYEKLQQQHAALLESEARYRALSESLKQRVQEQVKTIESAQRQLYQAEKMASVGQLAAGVAHEINNPIGFIRSNLSTAQAYVQKIGRLAAPFKSRDMVELAAAWQRNDIDFLLGDFAALLEESIGGADRVARIVADLKGFSNVDRAEDELVDLNESIRSVCNVASSQVRERAEVLLDLGDIPRLHCNAGRLNQVFLSLLLNAAQAMPKRGEIRIRSRFEDNEIRISFMDNGKGIEEALLARIFDPFFTTRDVGQGTGLGLTVSRDTVQAHGGRIEAKSKVSEGTTFTLYLPLR